MSRPRRVLPFCSYSFPLFPFADKTLNNVCKIRVADLVEIVLSANEWTREHDQSRQINWCRNDDRITVCGVKRRDQIAELLH